MKQGFAKVLTFLIATCAIPSMATTVVVSEFEDRTGASMGLGARAQEGITNLLVQLPQVKIVERGKMEEIMEEMSFSRSAYVDSSTAVEFGKKAGADHVIFGSVSNASYAQATRNNIFNNNKPYTVGQAQVSVNVRMVNVETNETVFSQTVQGAAEDTPNAAVVVPMALGNALADMGVPLQEMFPIEGYVIKLQKEGRKFIAYIDIGQNVGLTEGRRIDVFDMGEEIVHPITGEVLSSSVGEVITTGKVQTVMDQFSLVEIASRDFANLEVGQRFRLQPERGRRQGSGGIDLKNLIDGLTN